VSSREEDARARCELPREKFVRELEPLGSHGYFKSIPAEQTQVLDPEIVAHNREVIKKAEMRGRRPQASETPDQERKAG
jgi:hypothetical protein